MTLDPVPKVCGFLFTIVIGIASARAQTYPPITDRDYAIDLYQGTAIGSSRIVGMGGASVAVGEGASGMVANPASAAVRPATSNDRWDWDWTVDWLVPNPGTDHDNNGRETAELDNTVVLNGGILLWYKRWAAAVNVIFEEHRVDVGSGEEADPTVRVIHAAIGGTFLGGRLHIGLGSRAGDFSIGRVPVSGGGQRQELFRISGASLEAGAVLRPLERDFRFGVTVALPVTGDKIEIADCDPLNCDGYILPERVAVPWQIAFGVGWRRGPTEWNRQVTDPWRDEKALIVAVDLILTGAVDDGYGIEAFADKQLQPSGRGSNLSVRAGAEYEWIPGWLRVRAGSYWEPARFEGRDGRLHATAGVEVRVWSFCFWGDRYRARASLTVDGAAKYGNGGVSIGLWH